MYHSSAPLYPPPPASALPPGWTSHWSAEYQRVYYINSQTGETTWDLPSGVPQEYRPNLGIQRKPVATASSHVPIPADSGSQEHHTQQPMQTQRQNVQNPPQPSQVQYTPPYSPPQQRDAGGYFPPPVRSQAGTPNPPYAASPDSSNHGRTVNQGAPQHTFAQPPVNQQQQYFPPPPVSGSQQPQQHGMFGHSSTGRVPSPFQRPDARESVHYPPPPPGQASYNPQTFSPPLTPAATPSWQQNYRPQPGGSYPQYNPTQPYQPQHPTNYGQPAPQGSNQNQKSSGGMMGKIGSKFGQLQKTVAPGSTASPLKKWGTRAALGIGAIGAVALGADVMNGGLFDGAAGSGFDGSFFDTGDASSAQEAIDANATQLALAQQGQENALMLLDPPGTEYTVVHNNSLI